MKKHFLLFVLAFAASVSPLHAQLVVSSNGKVGIGVDTTTNIVSPLSVGGPGNSSSVFSATRKLSSTNYLQQQNAVYAKNYCTDASLTQGYGPFMVAVKGECYFSTMMNGLAVGVFGEARNGRPGGNFGVMGKIPENNNGAGIYGTTQNDTGIATYGNYAGYFNGNTQVVGNLNVTGSISPSLILQSASPDASVAPATEVSEEAFSSRLSNVYATAYHMVEEDVQPTQMAYKEDGTVEAMTRTTSTSTQILEKVHYGLSMEQLKESFPELVYEQEDGTQGVNYMELIPILVQTINELNERLQVVESGSPKKAKAQKATTELGSAKTITTDLKQIKYTLPADTKNAELLLCDASGKMIRKMDLGGGKADVKLNTSDLPAGIYLYSLVSGGKVMETKKMVVRK